MATTGDSKLSRLPEVAEVENCEDENETDIRVFGFNASSSPKKVRTVSSASSSSPVRGRLLARSHSGRSARRTSVKPVNFRNLRQMSTANEMLFPMHVMKVSTFVGAFEGFVRKQEKVPHHQALVKRGLVKVWRQGMGPVAFVSHQWTSYEHADPEFEQLGCLLRICQRIMSNDITKIAATWKSELVFRDDKSHLKAVEQSVLKEWVENGYIWFDYFSVPQLHVAGGNDAGDMVDWDVRFSSSTSSEGEGKREDEGEDNVSDSSKPTHRRDKTMPNFYSSEKDAEQLKLAVKSIPAYVECCEHFFVLCPPLEHKNALAGFNAQNERYRASNTYASWSRRGWCRAEAVARLLAKNRGPLIKLESAEGQPALIPPFEAWQMAPGRGEFTCCERKHQFELFDPGTGEMKMETVPCDKIAVGRMVRRMVDKKLAALTKLVDSVEFVSHAPAVRRETLFEYRWLLSVRGAMMDDLHPSVFSEEEDLEDKGHKSDSEGQETRASASSVTSTGSMNENKAAFAAISPWEGVDFRTKVISEEEIDDDEEGDGECDADVSFKAFMSMYRFSGVHDESSGVGWTPLRYAAQHGCGGALRAVKGLLDRGADIEAPLEKSYPSVSIVKGATILMSCAFWRGHPDVVGLLLDRGANMLAKEDEIGLTPLHCACVSCNVPFVDEIMSFCAPVPTQMTMEDSKDNEKKTAKHELPLRPRRVHKGSKHLYNTVLEARDLFGNTPLHIAALCGAHDVCVCLLELGSDTTAINEFAITPLHQASASEQDQFGSRTIEFLLDYGKATINCPSRSQGTSMKIYGMYTMAQLSEWFWSKNSSAIVRHFANECTGCTALHYAARVGSIIKVRVLLDRGADPLYRDDRGRTPRDHARIFGPFPAVEEILLEAEKLPWGAGSSAAAATATIKATTNDSEDDGRRHTVFETLGGIELNV